MALEQSAVSPTSAYFSTTTRAWELGVGGLIALAPMRLPTAVRPLLAWLGLAGILGDMALAGGLGGVPTPAVLPAVLGTALLLAANARTRPLRPCCH